MFKPYGKIDQRSIDVGFACEDRFEKSIKAHYGDQLVSVSKSSSYEDQREHWDFKIKLKSGEERKIDVKAMRRMRRGDENGQDFYFPVEFANVAGRPGWIYGQATHIAFEVKKGFLVVPRLEYLVLAEKLVNRCAFVDRADQAVYKCYTREGRSDVFAWIKRGDLLSLKPQVILEVA